jgi:hypothetical protein
MILNNPSDRKNINAPQLKPNDINISATPLIRLSATKRKTADRISEALITPDCTALVGPIRFALSTP